MRYRLAFVSAVLAGCFTKPGPPSALDDAQSISDAPRDSTPTDTQRRTDALDDLLCNINDTFDDMAPDACGTWGTETGAGLIRNGAKLVSTPIGTAGSAEATCRTHELQPSGTISIHLDVLGNSSDGHYASFSLALGGSNISMLVYRDGGEDTLTASCPGMIGSPVSYSAAAHRYLRYAIEPVGFDAHVKLTGSDTSNGVQSELVSCMVTLGAMHPMRLTFGSAIDVPGATSPSSQWDNLVYACQ